MIQDVKTIGADEFLEEAALRMEKNKISVLPVVIPAARRWWG